METEDLVNDIKDLFCTKLRAALPDRFTIKASYAFSGRTHSIDVSP